jgi:hypothetical protein
VFAPPLAVDENVSPKVLSKRKRRREREPESVKEWRRRMETTEAQQVFSLRKLIERVNAQLKNHGFGFMPVRGLAKGQSGGAVACPRQQSDGRPPIADAASCLSELQRPMTNIQSIGFIQIVSSQAIATDSFTGSYAGCLARRLWWANAGLMIPPAIEAGTEGTG